MPYRHESSASDHAGGGLDRERNTDFTVAPPYSQPMGDSRSASKPIKASGMLQYNSPHGDAGTPSS
jgi:hypothetical protein